MLARKMHSTITIEKLRALESPFPGRTFISIYVPKAPIELVVKQIVSELKRTEKSTNWKVKGAVIMMLNELIKYFNSLTDPIPDQGLVVYAVPKDIKEAIIHHILPEKNLIDLFFYVLDERFYVKDEHFNFS
jgi:hypothetical protein